ncbi:unnamed protein product [Macrosiphum euphorbiae]|uniref:Uncharacterized protein n=1 Tax=Macrosiphum euphorbiae TaxID=13131 RepID=A0AAV0VJR4_9HEMI|nr:unnamed protein product [Macrosiphum euphorbiae]
MVHGHGEGVTRDFCTSTSRNDQPRGARGYGWLKILDECFSEVLTLSYTIDRRNASTMVSKTARTGTESQTDIDGDGAPVRTYIGHTKRRYLPRRLRTGGFATEGTASDCMQRGRDRRRHTDNASLSGDIGTVARCLR